MKKKLSAFAALVAAGVMLALPSPALAAAPAATDTTASVAFTVEDRPDTGTGNPNVWARDTFARKVNVTTEGTYVNRQDSFKRPAPEVICDVVKQEKLVWKYEVVVKDDGTFVTANNSATGSPGAGAQLVKDATGKFVGGGKAFILAPAHWCSFEFDTYNGTRVSGDLLGSTGEFIAKLFGSKSSVELSEWGWTYTRCAEKWVNAKTGNSGDILGKPCASPSPSASASASASPSATMTSTSTASPSPDASLPLTGPKTGMIVGVGVIALVGGFALVLVSRSMRRKREVLTN